MIEAVHDRVVEHERIVAHPLGVAHEQRFVACRGLPCDQPRRIGDAVVAKSGVLLAGAGTRLLGLVSAAAGKRRRR